MNEQRVDMPFKHKEKKKPPPYLYYYRPYDEYAIDIIKNRRLYLKSPRQFNDPFDCSAYSLRIGPPKYYKKSFQNDLKKEYISQEQKNRIGNILITKEYEKPEFWNGLAAGMQAEINKFGIFSFTTRPDNFLMWSHYADKHNGICFGFEMSKMPTVLQKIMKVNYNEKRPIIEFSNQKQYHTIFDTKSPIWRYETEWRVVANQMANTHVSFPDEAITAVLCGVGMTDVKIEEVATYCLGFRNKPKLFRGVKGSTKYTIQFQQIEYRSFGARAKED